MSSTEETPISAFSKSFDSMYPDFNKVEMNDNLLYVAVLVVVILGIAYIYRDFILEKIQEYTLQMY